MSDKEFPSYAYDVCAEFDCEETMALALIATRNDLERTRKTLDVAIRGLDQMTWGCDSSDAEHLLKEIKVITALEQKDVK